MANEEEPMKARILFLFVLMVGWLQTDIFSTISSRVEGQVLDKETNQPIAGAEVHLISFRGFDNRIHLDHPESITDRDGKFKFDEVPNGRYFIEVQKNGYATFCPEYMLEEIFSEDFFNVFPVSEGMVKHHKIKMEKGGRLKISILKKTGAGTVGIQGLSISVGKVVRGGDIGKFADCVAINQYYYTNGNGEVIVDGLIPDDIYYFTVFSQDGLPYIEKSSIIKKNETVELSHIFDFTDLTGVAGNIQYSKGSVFYSVLVLRNVDTEKPEAVVLLNGRNAYKLINIPPGKYNLGAFAVYDDDTEVKKDIIIEVVKGKLLILDLKL